MAQLQLELGQLTARIEEMDRVIQKTAKENRTVNGSRSPGVGPVTATALIAAGWATPALFKRGEI